MKRKIIGRLLAALVVVVCWTAARPAGAETTLGSICRVKGQEKNTLHGMGIVVGLKGTGDGNFPHTIRALSVAMELMGVPVGAGGAAELKDSKNVALVTVIATVPPSGVREGDEIDCVISSVGTAKSLAGGRLLPTALLGPLPGDSRVYAFAEGSITLEDPTLTTTGRVHEGCRLAEDILSVFVKDGKVTLLLDKNHASFQLAYEVAELINSPTRPQGDTELAWAIDQHNVEVTIPAAYENHHVQFVSEILSLPIRDPDAGPRVVIHERAGSIVIGGDVEIGAVVVTHKNVVIETGGGAGANRFVPMALDDQSAPRLKALVEALNAVQVPTEDVIDIIKGLDRNGKLYAELIVQ